MSNFIPGAFPTTAPSSTTAVSFKTASSVSLSDSAAYPGSGPPPKKRDNQAYIQEQMLLRRAEFIRQKRIRIKIGSWNVAAIQGCERDLSDWIVDKKRDMRTISLANYVEDEADMANGDDVGIYVIALQEVVDVTATENFIKYTDPKISLNWKAHAQAALPNGYVCVASPQLIGVLLLVFVSPRLMSVVGSVSSTTVGTGLMGYVGNKGGAAVRLVLGDTLRLVFVDVHLAAFVNNTDRRNWDAAEIVRRANFEPVAKNFVGLDDDDARNDQKNSQQPAGETIDNADVVIWCGDLNYRIDLPNDDIRRLFSSYMPKDLPPTHDSPGPSVPSTPVMRSPPSFDFPNNKNFPPPPTEVHPEAGLTLEETIDNIMQYDQLRKQQRESKAFAGYKEGNIKFLPTYKYDVGTVGAWDSSEKARVPSWCDRVLWKVKGADGDRIKGRIRSRTRSSSILTSTGEVIFETSDSDEEDLVVSRGETSVPHAPSVKKLPISSFKTGSGEVKLEQLYYSSSQNISSSDHKPVVSLFELTFPSVISDLRTKTHADVAREVDKVENERRPIVTVIVDPVENQEYEEGVVDFGRVRLGQNISRSITIANTGATEAAVRFVGKPSADDGAAETPTAWLKEEKVFKDWLLVDFSDGGKEMKGGGVQLQPGDTCSITLSLLIEKLEDVRNLNEGKETLMDVLVLRVDGGRDVFLPLGGEWVQTGYGRSLSELIKVPEGAGGIRGWIESGSKGEVLYSAPRELYKMTEFLLSHMRDIAVGDGRWYSEPGWPFVEETWGLNKEKRQMLNTGVWECLDRDLDLSNQDALRIALELEEDEEFNPTDEDLVEVVAGVLMQWLRGLKEGIVPVEIWQDIFKAGGERKLAEQVLDKLSSQFSSVHANVFVYLTGFLMDSISTLLSPRPLGRAPTIVRVPTVNEREEPPMSPMSPMSPITSAAAMAFPLRRPSREVIIRRRVLEAFADVIIRRPLPTKGEKKGKADDQEKTKRAAFLETFVVGV
ncbi:uncharacterized protein H6S33_012668 [Morchella sextelata]|uniref:uncharacterized protein n=1 Tax=Morchella sextelata TaxID=1174677 RepID=UPI001D03F0B7|nr:uncharacterized protein H6S33_012668 [Morchella sextelata]KAH0610122.1 hypothetical protein H6S33_012668 [Morchella sextelata]